MARQIIKQPNGKLAIWSSIVDDFIITEATTEEYINFRIEEETARLNKEIPEIVAKLDKGIKIGYYDQTWEDALETIRKRHGVSRLEKLLLAIA